jgi:hypothetical protein
MAALLDALQTGWLQRQLGVSHETVRRWRLGQKVPENAYERLAAVGRPLRPEYSEAARPQWADGIRDEIVAGISAELTLAAADVIATRVEARLAARLGPPPPPPVESQDPPAAQGDADSTGL